MLVSAGSLLLKRLVPDCASSFVIYMNVHVRIPLQEMPRPRVRVLELWGPPRPAIDMMTTNRTSKHILVSSKLSVKIVVRDRKISRTLSLAKVHAYDVEALDEKRLRFLQQEQDCVSRLSLFAISRGKRAL